jgi:hypothetical protein
LISSDSNVYIESLLTVGDSIGGYGMVGIPDGLGAFDNGDGTFTSCEPGLMRAAVPWRHGANGRHIEWVIDKRREVLSART